MAKIKNSGMKNLHGDGNVKIFTDNSGKEYTISNSGMKNLHGDGYVQKVEERGSTGGWPMGENPVLMIIAFIAPILYIINTLKWGNDTVSHICMIAFIGSIILDGIIGFFTLGR